MNPETATHPRDIQSRAFAPEAASRPVGKPRRWTKQRPATPPAGQRLYDVNQAGDFLGVSGWSVREMIWRGDLPHVRVGRLIRVDLRDLENYIARNRQTGV